MKIEIEESYLDELVLNHLKLYLKRTRELWVSYNKSMEDWMKDNPSNEGAPREGSFRDAGITKFSRHGYGIRIECNEEIVEFDFIPKRVKKKDYLHIEEIDIYWSFCHFKSLHPNSKITEDDWIQSIENLNTKNTLTKLTWNKCAFPGYEMQNG